MNFSLKNQDDKIVKLSTFKEKTVVLYCYPKADTPGCTTQACAVRDHIKEFEKKNAVVIGLSADAPSKLKKFQEKYSLNFTLLSDPEHKVLEELGVWKEKSFMGRKYMGIERTTFLIKNGKIVKKFENVNPATHADLILSELSA